MYAVEDDDEQVVVLATLVERRYVAEFGVFVEDPAQSFACAAHINNIVFGAAHVFACLHGVACLCCVCLDVFCLGIAGEEAAEFVVCLAVSVLAEVDAALDDCNLVLVDDVAAVCNLCDDDTLAVEYNLIVAANSCIADGADELAVALVDGLAFVLAACNPGLGGRLVVLLGDGVEVGTCCKGCHDAVCCLLACCHVVAGSSNLTNLY